LVTARTGQWSFPIGLPIEFLGVSQRGPKLREIPFPTQPASSPLYRHFADLATSPDPEWSTDLSYEILGPFKFKSVGAFSETAFFHHSSKTLLVTDVVVSITDDPPPILQEDPRALLFHARDSISENVIDNYETRKKGWRRIVQFGLVFFPSQIDVIPFQEAITQASEINDPFIKSLSLDAPFNLYPWTWRKDADLKSFKAISQNGKLLCPPILTKLILDREPVETLKWVDRVCSKFDFKRIISSHLNNYVPANPSDFREAFRVLSSKPSKMIQNYRIIPQDLALLQKASDVLTKYGVVAPSQVCDGEVARTIGRFASF